METGSIERDRLAAQLSKGRTMTSNTSKEIQDAVNLQMQPLWAAVNGTAFDSVADLEVKQKTINELKAWADQTVDRQIRNARLYWISVAQYTIDHQRKDRAAKHMAAKILPLLSPLPNFGRKFPYE